METKRVHRIITLQALDALVGKHVAGERPRIIWQDAEGFFSFESEEEAREALQDPYYQHFLPVIESTPGEVHRIECFQPYTSDLAVTWGLVEKLAPSRGAVQIARHGSHWEVAFGNYRAAFSPNICLAICLAALQAEGLEVTLNLLESEVPGSSQAWNDAKQR